MKAIGLHTSSCYGRYTTVWRLKRLILIGLCATAIQYVILIFLVTVMGIPVVAASSVGFAISAASNYLANYHFTFRSNAKHAVAAPKFVVVALLGLLVNATTFKVLERVGGLNYLVEQTCAAGVVLLWNYYAHIQWTYKERC